MLMLTYKDNFIKALPYLTAMKFNFFDSHIHLRAVHGGPHQIDEILQGLKMNYRAGSVLLARTVFGDNTVKGFKFFEDYALKIRNKAPDYVYPFLMPDISPRSGSPDFDEVEYAKSRFEEGFVGVGEVGALAYKNVWKMPSQQHELFDLAGRYDFPVAGHLWHELEDYKKFLRRHPDTDFIQCHANSKALGKPDAWWKWAPEILEEFDNLYLELFYLDTKKKAMEGLYNMDAIKVIKEYPERFMIGTDATLRFDSVLGMPMDAWVDYWKKILSHLPKESAKNVSTNNIKRLINII